MLKLILFALIAVLVIGVVIGVIGATALSDSGVERVKTTDPELSAHRDAEKVTAPQMKSLLFGTRRAAQPVGTSAEPVGISQRPKPPQREQDSKQSDFAFAPPERDFTSVCECPECGWLDTHFLRASLRPPPTPAPTDKSWFDELLGWFADDKPQAVSEPAGDHPDAAVVRTCTKCKFIWAQR